MGTYPPPQTTVACDPLLPSELSEVMPPWTHSAHVKDNNSWKGDVSECKTLVVL